MKTQTWVIIVKFRMKKDIEKPARGFPFGPQPKSNPSSRVEITESTPIKIDKPILLIPSGEAEKVEVIPITGPMVIHAKDFRRRF